MQRPSQAVAAGTMLIRQGTLMPKELRLATSEYSKHWQVVRDGSRLDNDLRTLGWNSFFIAGQLRSVSLGFGEAGLRKGIVRLLKTVRGLDFNCLKLADITSRRFLGIPYRVFDGNACHIQESCFLQSAEERQHIQGD